MKISLRVCVFAMHITTAISGNSVVDLFIQLSGIGVLVCTGDCTRIHSNSSSSYRLDVRPRV